VKIEAAPLRFDEHGVASLDGSWEFFPGDHELRALDGLVPDEIRVPALWESQGYLELDGIAWYRRSFGLDSADGYWTLRFGAVMDVAEVYVNGESVGANESPFTPFDLDVTAALETGANDVAVRVFDPNVDDPEHIRLPHGKQGWANNHFPSRPSLYMTYGGIWQPVQLQRHGPLVVANVFVNADPGDVRVLVEIANRATAAVRGRLGIRALGAIWEADIDVASDAVVQVEAELGPTTAARWTPERPSLHEALVDVVLDDGSVSHATKTRFGLRTVRVEGRDIVVDDEPYRMKSVLVQGFHADALYAEASREEIEAEVLAAAELGFNTLRLHIKGFDPVYLDVCDELGMFLHCDLPVAEPIAHDELGDDNVLARRCVSAVEQQIRRDRNHPSIILWSATNELCLDRLEARYTLGYERFARALSAAVERTDPTRPYIENDWVEAEPEHVFCAPILTAHWYGRLHAEYLKLLERKSEEAASLDKPFYVTEYGDWGLPLMPELLEPPFWDTREIYARGLARTLWPGTVERFVCETQRYQGLSDRMQTEVFRRHGHIGGYCLTELTDVPHELNGILDLHRQPKAIAAAEVKRANQTVLPMLQLDTLVVAAGAEILAPVHVANDGPALQDVTVEARFGDSVGARSLAELLALDATALTPEEALRRFEDSVCGVRADELAAHEAACLGNVVVVAPDVPGSHDLILLLSSEGRLVAENRYPLHVVRPGEAQVPVQIVGEAADTAAALGAVGATIGTSGPAVVAEGALDAAAGRRMAEVLDGGGTVLALAQTPEQAVHFPVPVELIPVATKWGSSVFHFTTDEGVLTALPRRAVLVAEDSTVQASSVVSEIGDAPFPQTPVVIAYKPVPSAMAGTVVGAHRVGRGLLILCQYRLAEPASRGDAAALALLADLLRWAAEPRRVLVKERAKESDGRGLTLYSFGAEQR
jgi:Glycosyl hydrolases family 2, TIM barrel domain/Glycosyl hydrolases family 2, sugar binding domain/Glycosyl hydrolases family 2